jgi:hypothetical protein
MPIENEKKFVLADQPNLENSIIALTGLYYNITQVYLVGSKNKKLRIRKYVHPPKNYCMCDLNVKITVDGKVYEVETEIDESDFDAMSKVGIAKLQKTRYYLDGWEIDFFKTPKDYTYFVQAEFEMQDGEEGPNEIPSYISDCLIYAVEKGDSRFSSRKLANIDYATKLFNKLIKEKV